MDVLLHDWQLDAPLAAILAAAVVYALGMQRGALRRRARARARWYAAGLLALLVALVSPLAAYDDTIFWAHMLQHVLLLAVAPPLILLGRPAATSWRAFPLSYRRQTARAIAHSPGGAPLRAAVRVLTAPQVALTVFVATMAAWHIPALYDTTLRSTEIHDLEHVLFLATGLLFWSCLIDSPPLWSRLALPARALYATLAMAACWLLAVVLGFASTPLYAYPTARPGGLSAIGDQHLAAGIMWVPGSVPFVAASLLFAYRWLEPPVRRETRSVVEVAP
jgi:putative membrane protein